MHPSKFVPIWAIPCPKDRHISACPHMHANLPYSDPQKCTYPLQMLTKELKGATARPHGSGKRLQGSFKPEQPKSPATASPAASGQQDPNVGSLLELQQGLEPPSQPTQVLPKFW